MTPANEMFHAVLRTGTFRCGLWAWSARELVQHLRLLADEQTVIESLRAEPREAA